MIEEDNVGKVKYTVGFWKANLFSILLVVPVLLLFLIPFILIWDYESFKEGKKILMDYFFPILIGGIIIHELLHGITWAIFAEKGMKSIKFGVKWEFLTPYCHCKEPLKKNHYRAGGAMPLVILGIFPSITGIISGNGVCLCIGLFFTLAAAGDILLLFLLRGVGRESYIYDHPSKIGFWIKKV